MWKIGHRGAAGLAPENTLAAMRKALALGVHGIEFDIQMSKDGEPVVIHDDTLERTATGSGPVSHFTLAQLQQLDAGGGERIPTLRNVLDLVDKRCRLFIELKAENATQAVADILRHYVSRFGWSYEQLFVISFDHPQLVAIRTITPELRTGAIICGIPVSLAAFAEEAGAWGIIADIFHINQKLVDDAHRRKIKILAGTANNPCISPRRSRSGRTASSAITPTASPHKRSALRGPVYETRMVSNKKNDRTPPFGGDCELLLNAYASGYFPMADNHNTLEIHWFYPEQRGIIPLETFHVPQSLAKFIRKNPFEITTDTVFPEVIQSCAEREDGTWINDTILKLYCQLHEKGFAHSVECWRNGKLAGGLYGVALGGAFFGESMFSRETNASKAALVHLVQLLKSNGYHLLDTQYVNDHLKQFGVIEIPRDDYLQRLKEALAVTPQACF